MPPISPPPPPRPLNPPPADGPDGVTVTPPGPLRLPLGSHLDLRCTAAAVPSPLFAWAHGNASLATGSHLRLDFGDPGQAGEYRCRATNPILGRAAEATVLLLQDEGEWGPGAMGAGAAVLPDAEGPR